MYEYRAKFPETQGTQEKTFVINKLASHLFLQPPKALEGYKYNYGFWRMTFIETINDWLCSTLFLEYCHCKEYFRFLYLLFLPLSFVSSHRNRNSIERPSKDIWKDWFFHGNVNLFATISILSFTKRIINFFWQIVAILSDSKR